MSFPVQSHNAEKVQSDINTILEAIARFLRSVGNNEFPPTQSEAPLQLKAELESNGQDTAVVPDVKALPGWNPALLEGSQAPAFLLHQQTNAIVQIQIGECVFHAPIIQLPEYLEQLPPEQVATLAGVMDQPALSAATAESEEPVSPVIDIQVNGVSCFHQTEQGQVTINQLHSGMDLDVLVSDHDMGHSLGDTPTLPDTEQTVASHLQDTTITTEVREPSSPEPTVELRPAAEVESLTGLELGNSSLLHSAVLHQAASIRVERDQYGHVKGGSAIRAPIEVTEDAVDAEVYQTEHPLSAEAKMVTAQLKDYFQKTGEKKLLGEHYYDIHYEGDRLFFIPKDNPTEVVTVDSCSSKSISTERIEHLMLRFAAAYESICMVEQAQNNESELMR